MILERIKSEGIAHLSYFLGSGNSAAVIDPRRDIDIYLELARRHGMQIKFIFETHRNEDYVVGSLELAGPTGATIYHGPVQDFKYGKVLLDGQEFELGKLRLIALRTPGHSDDSMSYAVVDKATGQAPALVFTGDALFVNETGRVDFGGLSNIPRMASDLFESLFNRLLLLGDGVIICPGHGAGSICGSRIAEREESTIGLEKLNNPALKHTDKASFIRYKSAEQHEKPPYFSLMEKYNLEGAPLLKGLPLPPALNPSEFKTALEKGALVIDTNLPAAFGGSHVRGAYNIWLGGLPTFTGWFLPYDKPILLILENDLHLETATRYLIRIGYDNLAGYLKNGVEAWYNAGYPLEKLNLLSVHELKAKIDRSENFTLLDVREPEAWRAGHIAGSKNIYVGHIQQKLAEIPADRPVVVLCSVGRRAGVACSLLLRAGYTQVYNVLGSMTAWRQAEYPVVNQK
ncbi:MAG TPA: rhodanese-like domain-containing protein [Dehalococcoidales bacterium]|nr:rhodanese-like domain-containing protein [Dehalococcoidales bacterium]